MAVAAEVVSIEDFANEPSVEMARQLGERYWLWQGTAEFALQCIVPQITMTESEETGVVEIGSFVTCTPPTQDDAGVETVMEDGTQGRVVMTLRAPAEAVHLVDSVGNGIMIGHFIPGGTVWPDKTSVAYLCPAQDPETPLTLWFLEKDVRYAIRGSTDALWYSATEDEPRDKPGACPVAKRGKGSGHTTATTVPPAAASTAATASPLGDGVLPPAASFAPLISGIAGKSLRTPRQTKVQPLPAAAELKEMIAGLLEPIKTRLSSLEGPPCGTTFPVGGGLVGSAVDGAGNGNALTSKSGTPIQTSRGGMPFFPPSVGALAPDAVARARNAVGVGANVALRANPRTSIPPLTGPPVAPVHQAPTSIKTFPPSLGHPQGWNLIAGATMQSAPSSLAEPPPTSGLSPSQQPAPLGSVPSHHLEFLDRIAAVMEGRSLHATTLEAFGLGGQGQEAGLEATASGASNSTGSWGVPRNAGVFGIERLKKTRREQPDVIVLASETAARDDARLAPSEGFSFSSHTEKDVLPDCGQFLTLKRFLVIMAGVIDEGRNYGLEAQNAMLHQAYKVLKDTARHPSHDMAWGWPLLGLQDPSGRRTAGSTFAPAESAVIAQYHKDMQAAEAARVALTAVPKGAGYQAPAGGGRGGKPDKGKGNEKEPEK